MSGRAVMSLPLTNTAPSDFWRSVTASSSKGLLRRGKPAGCACAQLLAMTHSSAKATELGVKAMVGISGKEGEAEWVATNWGK
jgi:hypothetical protein